MYLWLDTCTVLWQRTIVSSCILRSSVCVLYSTVQSIWAVVRVRVRARVSKVRKGKGRDKDKGKSKYSISVLLSALGSVTYLLIILSRSEYEWDEITPYIPKPIQMPIHLFANQPTQLALNPSPKLQPSDDGRETRRRRRRRCWSVVSVSQSVRHGGRQREEAGIQPESPAMDWETLAMLCGHWRARIGLVGWWAGCGETCQDNGTNHCRALATQLHVLTVDMLRKSGNGSRV